MATPVHEYGDVVLFLATAWGDRFERSQSKNTMYDGAVAGGGGDGVLTAGGVD